MDGIIDNNITTLRYPCGIGNCFSFGEKKCIDGKFQITSKCIPDWENKLPFERCNYDNLDCSTSSGNSAFDVDSLFARPSSKQYGVCTGGKKTCYISWKEPASYDNDYLEIENGICDNLDNDCDGITDEGCLCTNGEEKPVDIVILVGVKAENKYVLMEIGLATVMGA